MAATAYSFDKANHRDDLRAYYFEWQPSFAYNVSITWRLPVFGQIVASSTSDMIYYSRYADEIQFSDGTASEGSTFDGWAAFDTLKLGLVYDASKNEMSGYGNGVNSPVSGTYDGAWKSGSTLNLAGKGGVNLAMKFCDIRGYDATSMADGKAYVEGLM